MCQRSRVFPNPVHTGRTRKSRFFSTLLSLILIQGCSVGSGGFLENDVLGLDFLLDRNEDRNFTQSTGISWATDSGDYNDSYQGHLLQQGLYWFNRQLLPNLDYSFKKSPTNNPERGNKANCVLWQRATLDHSTTLGITAYTPDDLPSFQPIYNDRPYASLLYLASTETLPCRSNGKPFRPDKTDLVYKSALSIGILGTTVAEDLQRWLHINVGTSTNVPNGWQFQISDGGEPTLMYSLERQKLIMESKNRKQQLSWASGFALGYYTFAQFGIDYKYNIGSGRKITPFYDIGGSRSVGGTEGIPLRQNRMRRSPFLFAGFRSRYMFHNSLLSGQFRDNEIEIGRSDTVPLVTTVSAGYSTDTLGWCRVATLNEAFGFARRKICKAFNDGTSITFSLHYRSKEYEIEGESRDHVWGGFYVSRSAQL